MNMDQVAAHGQAATAKPAPRHAGSRLIVIEGVNGVGKTTTARYLGARLGAALFHYFPEFNRFRQEAGLDECVAPLPRLVYYLGATLHLSDLVRARLPFGHVICDRYLASPLSLLIGEAAITDDEARRLVSPFESYLCAPDLILLLTAEHATASARLRTRTAQVATVTPVERQVLESAEFFRQREAALRRHACRLGPLVEMDTTALSTDEMCHSAWTLVGQRLGLATVGG
jgi:thymidylate kinase